MALIKFVRTPSFYGQRFNHGIGLRLYPIGLIRLAPGHEGTSLERPVVPEARPARGPGRGRGGNVRIDVSIFLGLSFEIGAAGT